ncbi:MAG: VCBS repeat-containing protein [Verrucomicrobiales bacterium]|nr:VCBS repeat-containing protein [Verrucomicrobiales bacterium]
MSALSGLGMAVTFEPMTLDTEIGIGYGLEAVDVNGDGRKDVVMADKDAIVWYENPTWVKHRITGHLTEKDHVCIAARDIDGDGRCEIAVGAQWNPGDTVDSGAVFYLIPPEDRTQEWEAVRLHHEPTTHRMRWVRRAPGRYDLVVVPLHGRGNVKGDGDPVKVLAYRMPKDPRGEWEVETVNAGMHLTHNFEVVPASNAEEPEDLLLAGREGIVRLSPTDKGWLERWITRHPTDSDTLLGAGEVRYGVLGGGRPYVAAIEPMHGHQLVVYTPPEKGGKQQEWTRQVLTDQLVDGHALMCRDLLGLGNRQIVVGWRSAKQIGPRVGIRLWSTTKENGGGWQEQMVDDNTMACEDLAVTDFDGDGKADIVACGRRTRNVILYLQR